MEKKIGCVYKIKESRRGKGLCKPADEAKKKGAVLRCVNDMRGDEASVPSDEASVPSDEASVPSDEASVPSDEANVPGDEASVPSDEASVPGEATSVPSDEANLLGDAHCRTEASPFAKRRGMNRFEGPPCSSNADEPLCGHSKLGRSDEGESHLNRACLNDESDLVKKESEGQLRSSSLLPETAYEGQTGGGIKREAAQMHSLIWEEDESVQMDVILSEVPLVGRTEHDRGCSCGDAACAMCADGGLEDVDWVDAALAGGDSNDANDANDASNTANCGRGCHFVESDREEGLGGMGPPEQNDKQTDSEDDNEIKNILDVLQNLKKYNFDETANFDNDALYEPVDDDAEDEETGKGRVDPFVQERNAPFLESEYVFKDPTGEAAANGVATTNGVEGDAANDSNEQEYLDLQKIKEKYRRYNFSLSDVDEEGEAEHVEESRQSKGYTHTGEDESYQREEEEPTDKPHEGEVKGEEERGGTNDVAGEMPHEDKHMSHAVDGADADHMMNTPNKVKKKKKKKRSAKKGKTYSEHCEGAGVGGDDNGDGDDGSVPSSGQRVSSGDRASSEQRVSGDEGQGNPPGETAAAEDGESKVVTTKREPIPNERKNNHDGGDLHECNSATESGVPSGKDEDEREEKMRRKKLLKQNICSLSNKGRDSQTGAGHIDVRGADHIDAMGVAHFDVTAAPQNGGASTNATLQNEAESTKGVGNPPYGDLSEEVRNIMNSNGSDGEEENHLEFDHYLIKLHNLKSLLRQETIQSDEDGGGETAPVRGSAAKGGGADGEGEEDEEDEEVEEGEEVEVDRDDGVDADERPSANPPEEPTPLRARKRGPPGEAAGDAQAAQVELFAERNSSLKREVKSLQREMARYKKMEKTFHKNREKYKTKLTLIREYEKKIDHMIMDLKKLKDTCTSKEKKLARFEEIVKYMNEQFAMSKIQFENKMNEYVLFLKKKDSEIYMLKEIIKEKEKIVTFNESILKQYKHDIDDMLRQNIERVEHVKAKLKTQQDLIADKESKIKTLEQDVRGYAEQLNKMDNEMKKVLYQREVDDERRKEIESNYQKEKKKNENLTTQVEQLGREKQDLHYKVESLLQSEKSILNGKAELAESQKVLTVENEQMKKEREVLLNERAQMEERCNLLSAENGKMSDQMEILQREKNERESELARLTGEATKLKEDLSKLKEEKDQIEAKNLTQQGEKDTLKNALEETKRKMEDCVRENEKLKGILNDVTSKNEQLSSKREQEEQRMKEQIKDLEDKLAEHNTLYCKEKEVIHNLSEEKNKFIKECERLKSRNKKIISKLKENQVKNKAKVDEMEREKKQSVQMEKDHFAQKVNSLEEAFQSTYNELQEEKNSLKEELHDVKMANEDLKKKAQNLHNVNEVLIKEMKTYNEEKDKFIKGLKNIKLAYLKMRKENEQLKTDAFSYIKKDVEENYIPLSAHKQLLHEQKSLAEEKETLQTQLKEHETLIAQLNRDKAELGESLSRLSKENEELSTNIRVKNKITEDVTANVEKLKSDLTSKDEEVKKKAMEVKKMERDYKKLLDDYKSEKKNIISKYENELDDYLRKCELAHAKYKKCEEEMKELKNKLKVKDEVIEYTHKEIENIKESFCNEYECKIKDVVEEKDKEVYAIQRRCKELHEDNNMNKSEIAKLNKLLEDANKKIKKRDMEMYILLEQNKKQKEKAAKKMTKVNELLNNLQKEYTDSIP
ncbi:microtubule and actin binding protein, putative [Plasmodium vivax]|uniref:Microtubule and actin binding protein, putative n=1 Tax=Plasmodium vivax TaxID=5855 RepID=A0A1G4HBZ7_PLAVI|nr:microtubule and actin binding protein, putative [Plasmodium vivax]